MYVTKNKKRRIARTKTQHPTINCTLHEMVARYERSNALNWIVSIFLSWIKQTNQYNLSLTVQSSRYIPPTDFSNKLTQDSPKRESIFTHTLTFTKNFPYHPNGRQHTFRAAYTHTHTYTYIDIHRHTHKPLYTIMPFGANVSRFIISFEYLIITNTKCSFASLKLKILNIRDQLKIRPQELFIKH